MREPTGPGLGPTSGPAWADIGIGLGVLALAGLAVVGTLSVPASPLYARVGPTLFPWIAAAGLGGLGAVLLGVALSGGWSRTLEDRPRDPFNPASFGLVLAGLLVNAALIDVAGFVLASTAQFVLVSACFGSRAPVRDALIGFSVCLGAYLLFARLLGVNIGAGLVEGLVGRVI